MSDEIGAKLGKSMGAKSCDRMGATLGDGSS
jgi:hypothetical protein